MNALPTDAREANRLAADAAKFAQAQQLWRVRSDLAGRFTTPEKRLAAAEELAALLGQATTATMDSTTPIAASTAKNCSA